MTETCHAVMHAGVMHTLRRTTYTDHRKDWKWVAFADGDQWRLFKSVKDWRAAVPGHRSNKRRGPHADATDRAVCWSEFEGRQLLDVLAARYAGKAGA